MPSALASRMKVVRLGLRSPRSTPETCAGAKCWLRPKRRSARGQGRSARRQEVDVKRVMIRYRVKPDPVAENEHLVRDVYEELARTRPEGLRYGTFKLDDGVSFVHLAVHAEDNPRSGKSRRSGGFRRESATAATNPPRSSSSTRSVPVGFWKRHRERHRYAG